MEEIICNVSPETDIILNEKKQVKNSDLLITQEIKNKNQKKDTRKQQKTKMKISLNNSLDNSDTKKLAKTITEKGLNDINDISDFSRKSKIVRDNSEFDFNKFGKLNISPKFGMNSNDNKNFYGKSNLFNNMDNNKRKISDIICDYYSGCDKFLSKTETNTVDLSTSLNFVKKEKFKENYSGNYENYNSNTNMNDDFVNNNYGINNKYTVRYLTNSKKHGFMRKIVANSKQSKFIFYNKYYVNYKFNVNRNYIDITGDWKCGNCGNYNYSFRDFCNRCNSPKL